MSKYKHILYMAMKKISTESNIINKIIYGYLKKIVSQKII